MTLSHDETVAAITSNDPPIRPMQRWEIKAENGAHTARAMRILAKHPESHGDGIGNIEFSRVRWIYREEPVHGPVDGNLGWIPEYNLRRLFTLDAEGQKRVAMGEVDASPLWLPHKVYVEAGAGQEPLVQEFKTEADIDRLARDLHGCIRELETIARFASGSAADTADRQLQRVGYWTKEAS